MQESVKNESGVGFKEFVSIVWAKKWMVLAITLAISIVTLVFSLVLTETKYSASCKMLVVAAASNKNDASGSLNENDITSASRLVDTCLVILNTKTFFDMVVNSEVEGENQTVGEKYGYTRSGLMSNTSFSVVNDTGVFEVVFESESKQEATDVMKVIYANAQTALQDKFGENSVKPVEDVYEPVETDKNIAMKTVIGFLVGIVVGVAVVFIINLFDVKVRSAEAVKNRYDITILGELI